MNTLENLYNPKTFAEFIFPNRIVEAKVMQYLNHNERKPLLLYGDYGTGKTTIARLLCEHFSKTGSYVEHIDIRNADKYSKWLSQLEHENKFFHLIESTSNVERVISWEEFEIDNKSTYAFKRVIDLFPTTHLLICTCNYEPFSKLNGGIKQRFNCVEVEALSAEQMLPYALRILKEQGMLMDNELLLANLNGVQKSVRNYFNVLSDLIAVHRFNNETT